MEEVEYEKKQHNATYRNKWIPLKRKLPAFKIFNFYIWLLKLFFKDFLLLKMFLDLIDGVDIWPLINK